MSLYLHPLHEQQVCKRKIIDAKKHPIEYRYGYTAENNIYNALVKVKGIDKFLRGKSEMVLLSEDRKQVFLEVTKSGKYKLPGGSWDESEDVMTAAIRETEEEIFRIPKNVIYIEGMDYIEFYSDKKDYQKTVPDALKWCGVYCKVFSGIDGGIYKKRVNEVDRDDIAWKGHFYDIDKVYNILLPVHKKAIKTQQEGAI